MNPWIVVDQATVPGDGGEMKLLQRTHEFTITEIGSADEF